MRKNKGVVFTFGRFQPVTIGHEKLINRVLSESKEKGFDHIIVASQTEDCERNPLPWSTKRRMLEMAFPGVKISDDKSLKTPYQVLEYLSRVYDEVEFVCGSDRIENFSSMEDYALKEGAKKFVLESAGSRLDKDAVSKSSATAAREAANCNNFEQFYSLMPERVSKDIALDIFNKIRGEELEENPEWMNREAEAYRKGTQQGKFIYIGSG